MNLRIDNASGLTQRGLVRVGLPTPLLAACGRVVFTDAPGSVAGHWSRTADGRGVVMDAEVPTGTQNVLLEPQEVPPFNLAFAAEELVKLVPYFRAEGSQFSLTPTFWNGSDNPPLNGCWFRLVEETHVSSTWEFRTLIPGSRIRFRGWITIPSERREVEYVLEATYGTTLNDGQLIAEDLPAISFFSGFEACIDNRIRSGRHLPVFWEQYQRWELELAPAMTWSRGSRVVMRGALNPSEGRRRFPLAAVSLDWDDSNWGPIGIRPTPVQPHRLQSAKQAYLEPTSQGLYSQRARAAPKVSGTTGEQEGFGVAECIEAVSFREPYAANDYLWHCEAWGLMPTGNREPDGGNVLAVNHPQTKTGNQRPDHRFSRWDMLGWPNPVPYSWGGSGYTTRDRQHYSHLLLVGTYMLTRDPWIRSILDDLVQLDFMDLAYNDPSGTHVGSPRAAGRALLSWAWMDKAGIPGARELCEDVVRKILTRSAWTRVSPLAPVRCIHETDEAKYGWQEPNGTGGWRNIRGWQPWQDSIALIGMYAVLRMRPEWEELERACRIVAENVTRWGFFSEGGRWYHIYALKWFEGGEAPPAEDLRTGTPNYSIVVEGSCSTWTSAGLKIAVSLGVPNADKAAEVLAARGAPTTWEAARWLAV